MNANQHAAPTDWIDADDAPEAADLMEAFKASRCGAEGR